MSGSPSWPAALAAAHVSDVRGRDELEGVVLAFVRVPGAVPIVSLAPVAGVKVGAPEDGSGMFPQVR